MIAYCDYMTVFAEPIKRLRQAVYEARVEGCPEEYGHAVRLFIHDVLWEASASAPVYTMDPEVYLP